MKRITALLLIALFAALGFAQAPPRRGGDFNAKFIDANKMMEEKLWLQSISKWKECLEIDPNNPNVNYKIGQCLLQTANSKLEALQYLEVACANKYSKSYDPNDPTETKAPIDAMFSLGKAQALNLQLDNAIATYETYQKKLGKKHLRYGEVQRELDMANEAKTQMANPRSYIITNVGPVINKETNDFSPVLSLDESTMFFTSRRLRADTSNSVIRDIDTGELKEDVYVSFKNEDGVWTEPEILNLNTDEHDATISVAPDGQTLFIYRDNYGDGQVLESKLFGETWSTPLLLGSDINSDSWETHATVSADGNTLYFVSDRSGGLGKRDLYKCVKLPNGEWSRALNMGPTLNTKWDEDSPFLSPDGKTLYFSSMGHKTMGGFDIFVSKLGEDGEWGVPQNLGYPLNTVEDDIFFVPMADGRRAYYSSSKDGGYGLKDIYLVDMPDETNESSLAVLKGFIIAPEGEELPEDLRIVVTNLKNGEVMEYRPRKRDGGYLAILSPCTGYHVDYYKGAEVIKKDDINVPCESKFEEINREVFLVPVTMGEKPKPKPVEPVKPEPVKPEPKPEPVKPQPKPEPVKEVEPEPAQVVPAPFTDFKYDPKDPINREFNEKEAYAQFSRYFVYDFHEFGVEEKEFTSFIGDVKKIIDLGKKPVIVVESSASNVPSSRFKNNQELTAWRNKTATDQIRTELKKLGMKEGVNYTFGTPVKLVQGKKYENDAQKNRLLYEEFQYIKIKVQG